ncbi:uncharacterized protein [Henckelia pumila]|uniref:uncharacterized protein n=1 Tax=Henckelia pumila TaxID=405737 RepID=UPI003C6E4ADC
MQISGESCSSPEDLPAPAHNPLAPPDESFDISTTVDPSFVISLIRKLVPSDLKHGENAIESGLHEVQPKNEDIEENVTCVSENGEVEGEGTVDNDGKETGPKTINDKLHQGVLAQEKIWEECGCILWDLAASRDHAQLMAENLVIDVLLANLMVSKSGRVTEISLGIIGNLTCHEILRKQISSSNGLIKMIVDQLFLDDIPSLCEAFRVIITFLQISDECVIWAEALQTEQTLCRIMWISDNSLNRKLFEKCARFIFDVLFCEQVAAILLQPMMKLGLSSVLINLLAFEMSKFREEEKPESDEVLDYILLSIRALLDVDDYSEEICSNKQLLQLLVDLIKFHDKSEIPNACVTVTSSLAKIVAAATYHASEMSQDLDILQGLLDALPFVDTFLDQASMWSIIARLLTLVRESEVGSSFLNRLVSILTRNFDLLEGEIAIDIWDDMDVDSPRTAYAAALVIGIKRISCILTQWKLLDDEMKNTASTKGYHVDEEDVDKLLEICSKALILSSPISRESCASCEEPPAPAHHPSVPLHESFEISTTVDPTYVASLIRKLLPSDVKDGRNVLGSGLCEKEPKSEGIEENVVHVSENGEVEAKETVDSCGKQNGPKTIAEKQQQGGLAQEKTWEECGCILWDLSKRKDHARLIAQNHIGDVLLANLMVSQSARITEICLGIIGNLAWDEIAWKQICFSNGLVKVIVDQLFLDDVPNLCQVCWVITWGLRSHGYFIWAEALKSEQTLSRMLWISENALNSGLFKESMNLVSAVVRQEQVAAILLPHMTGLGLSSRLINLLACEISKYHKEQKSEGDEVLVAILSSIEALCVMEDCSEEICLNKELLQLLEELIKFPDKLEIPNACVDASTLLARILSGNANVEARMSQDLDILQGILEAIPFADCHVITQASMWSIIARLLNVVQESEVTSSFLNRLVSILSSKLDLMKQEVDFHIFDDMDYDPPPPAYVKLLLIGLKRIACT